MHTGPYLILNKKKSIGAAHLGPRGLDCVVCQQCSASQEAVTTTIAGAKGGLSRLLSAGTLLFLTDTDDDKDTTAVVLVLVRTRNHKSVSLKQSLSILQEPNTKHSQGIRDRLKATAKRCRRNALTSMLLSFLIVNKHNENLRRDSPFYLILQLIIPVLSLNYLHSK